MQDLTEGLRAYKKIPVLQSGDGMASAFRVDVEPETPLHLKYGVTQVAIHIPIDAVGNRVTDLEGSQDLPSTIEVSLHTATGEIVSEHSCVSGGQGRFFDFASLLLFLDRLQIQEID